MANSPGYHIAPNGRVYSDHCSVHALRKLRRRIYRQFYPPAQIARVARKAFQDNALSFLQDIRPHLPRIAIASAARVWQRSRRAFYRRY